MVRDEAGNLRMGNMGVTGDILLGVAETSDKRISFPFTLISHPYTDAISQHLSLVWIPFSFEGNLNCST